MAILNIGLTSNLGGTISHALPLAILYDFEVRVIDSAIRQSDSEPTLVLLIQGQLTDWEATKLALECDQDCIAQLDGDVGSLHGPKAVEWGPFDPKQFLLISGQRAG
jgi:hypothetical protein